MTMTIQSAVSVVFVLFYCVYGSCAAPGVPDGYQLVCFFGCKTLHQVS